MYLYQKNKLDVVYYSNTSKCKSTVKNFISHYDSAMNTMDCRNT